MDSITLRGLQPEHQRYWLAYRLWLDEETPETWESICAMSLNQVHLLNLLLDSRDAAREAARKRRDRG